jgi:hypothetical protein
MALISSANAFFSAATSSDSVSFRVSSSFFSLCVDMLPKERRQAFWRSAGVLAFSPSKFIWVLDLVALGSILLRRAQLREQYRTFHTNTQEFHGSVTLSRLNAAH